MRTVWRLLSMFLFVTLLFFSFGCASSSGNSHNAETYATGLALEEEGYPQGAIAMYASSVSFDEISQEVLQKELDRMLKKLGRKAFEAALDEAYELLNHIRLEAIEEGDQTKARVNEYAMAALRKWEELRGTTLWKAISD